MEEIIIKVLDQFGYVGIFLLIAIENIFPPIPSEIILTFGGFMTTYTRMNVWGVIIAATLGSVFGAIVLYLLGMILNTEKLERLFASKLGRILHLKQEDVQKAEAWFVKHGKKAIFFCRFVPIVRSLISIPAGVARISFIPFLLLTICGTFIWNVVLVFLGRAAGDAWETIAGYFDTYSTLVLMFFIILALVLGGVFVKYRFLDKENQG